jgi:hypothetical protein
VAGYPIESVTITGPNSINLVCPKTSGHVTCSTTDSKQYEVTVTGFDSSKGGLYTCTVKTNWYKTDGTKMGSSKSDTVTLTLITYGTLMEYVEYTNIQSCVNCDELSTSYLFF